MRARSFRWMQSLAVLLGLGLLAGCQDEEARQKLTKSADRIGELEAELKNLQSGQKETAAKLESLGSRLSTTVNERLDKIDNAVASAEKKLRDDFIADQKKASDNARAQIDGVRSDFDGRLNNVVKKDLANDLEQIRGQIEKNRKELLGFMDGQLKELYPYAYQPRRMDPNEAPEAPKE